MKKLKKQLSMLLVLALLLGAVCLLVGCENKDSDDISNPYVGDFHSVFVDSQNNDNSVSFTLSIKEDHTFVLHRNDGSNTISQESGSWKSYTNENQMQLLCLIDSQSVFNKYFSLVCLDDGTLMATAGITSNYYYSRSAFGSGGPNYELITLVLFEKD